MGVQRWPWSTIRGLFGVTVCGFVCTLRLLFISIQGEMWRPNVLKAMLAHPGVLIESSFFCNFAPTSSLAGSQSHHWVPFWRYLGSCCHLFGIPWTSGVLLASGAAAFGLALKLTTRSREACALCCGCLLAFHSPCCGKSLQRARIDVPVVALGHQFAWMRVQQGCR